LFQTSAQLSKNIPLSPSEKPPEGAAATPDIHAPGRAEWRRLTTSRGWRAHLDSKFSFVFNLDVFEFRLGDYSNPAPGAFIKVQLFVRKTAGGEWLPASWHDHVSGLADGNVRWSGEKPKLEPRRVQQRFE